MAILRTYREAVNVAAHIENLIKKTGVSLPGGSEKLFACIIAAEDRRYYYHYGFDIIGIARAIWQWLRSGRISGASTIEQQLVRTIRVRYEITLGRKISELLISTYVSCRFRKSDILSAYVAVAYYGWRAVGINQLARRFNLDLNSLDWRAASCIAAMLKIPLPQFPTASQKERLVRRADYILDIIEKDSSRR